MKKNKIIFVLASISLAFSGLFAGNIAKNANAYSNQNEMKADNKVLTISELGNATINNGSYYDDGVIYYTNSGSTVGYYVEENILVDFNISYKNFSFPMWLGFTFKAGEYNRTQSPYMEKKGYSFMVYCSGVVELWKEGVLLTSTSIAVPTLNYKYNYCMGTKTENEGTRLLFSIDSNVVLDFLDTNPIPYSEKSWFNISGDGGTAANIYSLKKTRLVDYQKFTLSSFNFYPEMAGHPMLDKYNNIRFTSSGETVGFNNSLQNFAFEAKITYLEADPGTNVWFALRTKEFNRAENCLDGYTIRIGYFNIVEIYKNGTNKVILGSGSAPFEVGTPMIYEFGAVDTTTGGVLVYVAVNGSVVLSVEDNENPWKQTGWINMNPDGHIIPEIKSTNASLSVLQVQKEIRQDTTEVRFYIHNAISSKDLNYDDFSNRLLDAIILEGNTLSEINSRFYSIVNGVKSRAVDAKLVNNVLVLNIGKKFYEIDGDAESQFEIKGIELSKTKDDSGIYSELGFSLTQSYFYSF